MGLWEWGAFSDRTKFFGKCKALVKSKFSISALPLLANEKLQKFVQLKTFNHNAAVLKESKNFGISRNFNPHTAKTNSHRNNNNEQLPFLNTFATVSLQYDIPFSKSNSLASAPQLPFRTGSKHPKKRVAPHTGLGTRDGSNTKNIILQSFEPRSQGLPRVLFVLLFARRKK